MILYFVRHGHMNATTETPVDPKNGQIDESLSDEGVKQADVLADELSDVHLDAILSSPLKRASQTAKIINKYHQLPIQINASLRERDTGGYVDGETWSKLFNFDDNFSVKGFEDLREFFERVYGTLDNLKEQYAHRTILIVSHGGVHQALYSYVNKLPLKGETPSSPLHNCESRIYEL